GATEGERMWCRFWFWSAIALPVSILVTGGYTISKVVSGYRNHRDALAVFGRDVRRKAEAHHWRYEALSAKDEGLLLYLRKTHFIASDRAIGEWNGGNLDALVVPTDKAPPQIFRDCCLLGMLKSDDAIDNRCGDVHSRQHATVSLQK